MNAPSALDAVMGFVLLGLVFGAVEHVFRNRPGPAWWRRADTRTDLLWFACSAVFTRALVTLCIGLTLIALVLLHGRSVAAFLASAEAGQFPDLSILGLGRIVGSLPVPLQVLMGLFVSDLIGYWTHRCFHRRRLWRIHAVHHSSTRLDWLSSVRVHPLNTLIDRTVSTVPLLMLGFHPAVFAFVAPFLTLYAVMLHANVGWTFGRLRTVIASPAFHRWHHTAEGEGMDKNFAGLFPILDLIFGTYFMPDRSPTVFGVRGDPLPGGFLGQLGSPFRRRAATISR